MAGHGLPGTLYPNGEIVMGALKVQDGSGITMDYTPGSAVTAGDVVATSNIVGVANRDIAANELGVLDLDGIYDFTKVNTAETMAIGNVIYWTTGATKASTPSGIIIGKCVKASSATDTTVRVYLSQ